MMNGRLNGLLALIAVLILAAHGRVQAQAFPNKPARLLVGVTAGGGVDLASRVVAAKLGEMWGQQVVVENRTGACHRSRALQQSGC